MKKPLLSDKEIEVVTLNLSGKSNKEIAKGLAKTEVDISQTLSRIREKVGHIEDTIDLLEKLKVIRKEPRFIMSNKGLKLMKKTITDKRKKMPKRSFVSRTEPEMTPNGQSFEHDTLKEIFEEPTAVLNAGENTKKKIDDFIKIIKNKKNIYITGCGSSWFAAILARSLFRDFVDKKIEPIPASHTQLLELSLNSNAILLTISQSGNSGDIIEAVKLAKKKKCKVISIVNETKSELVEYSDLTLELNCGSEIGVAATKSFAAEISILYKILNKMCDKEIVSDMNKVSNQLKQILGGANDIHKVAVDLVDDISTVYIPGVGTKNALARESARKIKELADLPAEAMNTGELDHNPMSLNEKPVHVILSYPDDDQEFSNNLSVAVKAKRRGAKIIGISSTYNDIFDYWIKIPKITDNLYPLIALAPIHLLAYYIGIERGIDPDHREGLQKTVALPTYMH